MLKNASSAGGLVLFSLLYFVITGFDSPVVSVLWSSISGVLIVLLLRLTPTGEDSERRALAGGLLALASVVIGTLLKALVTGTATILWDSLGVAIAAFTAWGFESLQRLNRGVACFLCRRTVATADSFKCPRCGQTVCAAPGCWSSRHLRCTSCLEREVVLFPARGDDWWNEQFDLRVSSGVCDSCYKEARETDLRACGECPLLMCRRCWDHHNGRCTRCRWHIPDLPARLRPFMTPAAGRRHPRRAGGDDGNRDGPGSRRSTARSG